MSEAIESLLREVVTELKAIRTIIGSTQPAAPSKAPLRNIYSVEEFHTEILEGKRTKNWIQDQCRARRIKVISRRPYLIPQSEALRFLNPPEPKRYRWEQ